MKEEQEETAKDNAETQSTLRDRRAEKDLTPKAQGSEHGVYGEEDA
jgi:hypothetical protein